VLPTTSGPAFQHNLEKRARGRICVQLDKARMHGVETLLVSEENIAGSVRASLRAERLYPDIGERVSRYVAAFDRRIDRVVVTVRALHLWWRSAALYGVTRGVAYPDAEKCVRIAGGLRGWRDVIVDLACALPENTEIIVIPFESFDGRPATLLNMATGHHGPVDKVEEWLNRAPDAQALRSILSDRGEKADITTDADGRVQPFTRQGQSALSELYADDMFWLVAGADGLAKLTEDPMRISQAKAVGWGMEERGLTYVGKEGPMAQPG
jgi:hypothetical protein